jgi:diguanylate cyclase (GGDEF)-like protein/hemerythrin-like metal-binding protein/PAS domain S-box-containing protein
MQPFYWNKSYEIGIPEVDQQHQMLLDLINDIADAVDAGAQLPEIDSIASAFTEYAVSHFAEEEILLDASSLPAAEKEAHRRAHRAFVEKVQHLTQREDLLEPEIIQSILEFLVTWLVSHILGTDRKLGAALNPVPPTQVDQQAILDVSPVERILLGALTETERRFRLISDNTPVLIWVADAMGRRGFFNRAWANLLGLSIEEVARAWKGRIHPEDRAAYFARLEALLVDPRPIEAEFRIQDGEGKDHWFLEKILPRSTGDGAFGGLIASATDITSIKETELLLSRANEDLEAEVARRTAQLEQMMQTDPLTGISNRRHLMSIIEMEVARAIRYGRDLSVLFVDVDHFKKVNDTFGHAVGDKVLVAVAGHLKGNIRITDAIGRYGGEEFVVVMPDTPLEGAKTAAERWLGSLRALDIPGVTWPITASGGVAQFRSGDTMDEFLSRSDRALYQAKADGRACVRVG